MMRPQVRRAAAIVMRTTPVRSFRSAAAGTPAAFYSSFALLLAIGVIDIAWAHRSSRPSIVLMSVLALLAYTAALSRQDARPAFGSVLCASIASCAADLPVNRPGWGGFAAIAGALILVLTELETAAVEPPRTGERIRRPNVVRVAWVAGVAVGGGALGWLILSLRSGLAGLGLLALGIGVASAVCVVVLVGALVRTALAERGDG